MSLKRLGVLGRGPSTTTTDSTVFDDVTFARLFPEGVPIVYNFGGFKRTIDSLFAGRDRKVSGHGYDNEGSTTTRFDMMTMNRCDRFTIVVDAVERAYANNGIDRATRDRIQTWCADQLKAHDGRMAEGEFIDPVEITNGVWTKPELPKA